MGPAVVANGWIDSAVGSRRHRPACALKRQTAAAAGANGEHQSEWPKVCAVFANNHYALFVVWHIGWPLVGRGKCVLASPLAFSDMV